jgi:hypothetical protein
LLAFINTHKFPILAYVIVFMLALVLRLAIADRFAPFVDYPDESFYVALGQHVRGISDESAIIQRYGDFPPLYITFTELVQNIYDQFFRQHSWNMPADYYVPLRITSAIMGVLTALCIGWMGYTLGGHVGALSGAWVWAVAPLIVNQNTLVLPDPLLYLMIALAVAAGLSAWRYPNPYVLLVSLLAGIAVIYTKFWVITAVFPFVVVFVWHTYQDPKRWLKWGILYGVIIGVSMLQILVFDNPTSGGQWRPIETWKLFNLNLVLNNLSHALLPLGGRLFALTSVLFLGMAWFMWHNKLRIRLLQTTALFVLAFLSVWLSALIETVNLNNHIGQMRHVLPATVLFVAVWGVMLGQLWLFLPQLLKQNSRMIALVVVAGLFIIRLPNDVLGNIQQIAYFNKTHMMNVIWNWSDANLPNDGIILLPNGGEFDALYNRTWGAYAGDNPLPYWFATSEELVSANPQDYSERGMTSFGIEQTIFETSYSSAQPFIDQLTLIKTFMPDSAQNVGSGASFYRLAPPQTLTDVLFGEEIRLVGYDLQINNSSDAPHITLRPYWRIQNPPSQNYSVFVHLYSLDSNEIIAQTDGAPTTLKRLTLQWNDPKELYIGQNFMVTLPEGLQEGEYNLVLGLYNPLTNVRLLQNNLDNFLIRIVIK